MKFIPIRQQALEIDRPREKADRPPQTWRFRWLLVAPHRLGFFAAAVMLGFSSIWWSAVLVARAFGHSPAWSVSPSAVHALLMSMGFMPLFIVGFLFTAGPKWLGLPAVQARSLLPAIALMLGGWTLAVTGFHVHTTLASAGVAMVATGWSGLCLRFIGLLRQSRTPDRLHACLVAFGCSVGALALGVAALALATGTQLLLRSAVQIALWGFVAPIFATVAHRMIPFFSSSTVPLLDAWRPMWLLWVMLLVLWLEGLLAVTELWWPLPPALRWAQVCMEVPVAMLWLWLAVRWGLIQSLKIRLLAMLHGGFVWLGIALALNAVSHSLMALTDGELSLGLAPLHAMTMGYLGATLFAMTTRVSSGHGGRPLAADNIAWTLYWVLQSAIFLRVIAALWPAVATPFTLVAVLAWTTAMVGWALRYGSWFGRPRLDGRPG